MASSRRAKPLAPRAIVVVAILALGAFSLLAAMAWSPLQLQLQPLASPRATLSTKRVKAEVCSPPQVDVLVPDVNNSAKTFYEALAKAERPVPELRGDNRVLCNPRGRYSRQWTYCLPMSALRRADDPRCANPNAQWQWNAMLQRHPHYDNSPMDEEDAYAPDLPDEDETEPLCYGAVLHLLLLDVYDALRAHDLEPALLFGTLLGAVRNGTIIPFTEDADVGFRQSKKKKLVMKRVKDTLWAKGYHTFLDKLYRVCIAPTHPLAGLLFDPEVERRGKYHVPYVDLYAMHPEENATQWRVSHSRNESSRVASADFEPYASVRINGDAFDTLANPTAFLKEEYGDDYLTPRARDQDEGYDDDSEGGYEVYEDADAESDGY